MIVEDQSEVIAFLSRPDAYGADVGDVERLETHASIIFLAGPSAYKLKRAVRFPYLDYSTAERRRRFCEAEVAGQPAHRARPVSGGRRRRPRRCRRPRVGRRGCPARLARRDAAVRGARAVLPAGRRRSPRPLRHAESRRRGRALSPGRGTPAFGGRRRRPRPGPRQQPPVLRRKRSAPSRPHAHRTSGEPCAAGVRGDRAAARPPPRRRLGPPLPWRSAPAQHRRPRRPGGAVRRHRVRSGVRRYRRALRPRLPGHGPRVPRPARSRQHPLEPLSRQYRRCRRAAGAAAVPVDPGGDPRPRRRVLGGESVGFGRGGRTRRRGAPLSATWRSPISCPKGRG